LYNFFDDDVCDSLLEKCTPKIKNELKSIFKSHPFEPTIFLPEQHFLEEDFDEMKTHKMLAPTEEYPDLNPFDNNEEYPDSYPFSNPFGEINLEFNSAMEEDNPFTNINFMEMNLQISDTIINIESSLLPEEIEKISNQIGFLETEEFDYPKYLSQDEMKMPTGIDLTNMFVKKPHKKIRAYEMKKMKRTFLINRITNLPSFEYLHDEQILIKKTPLNVDAGQYILILKRTLNIIMKLITTNFLPCLILYVTQYIICFVNVIL
jgi:hypothetical protein